jgi:hypothetical protein
MTQLTLEPSGRMAVASNIDLSTRTPLQQPVFFYDGDFRTMPQLERRVQLNTAIAAFVARPLQLTQAQISS